MVTIIKNQLLKHLSRYTKNLSPEQISLSALRGSGELQDLTLDEDLLTDLLELPGWLRLTSAKCNRASFRIQWTKLKTVPIVLNLDEVHIAVEVCTEPRTMNTDAAAAVPAQGKYSYIHKVIDGISVAVNQVQIDFSCDAFTSSVQISRVTVESRTPEGRKGDLRLTRIKSPDTGQLLIFKELEWQTARIEAKQRGPAGANLPPLRLLLGTALCRIVIKKRLSDCAVLGSRLVFRPEAVAWALTNGQLRAVMACLSALAEPVKRATAAATRAKATRKVEEPLEQIHSRSSTSEQDMLARLFAKHDVRETSYHLLAPRIDLHLCDDPGLGRSEKPSLLCGGALQVTLVSMQADLFPYHRAAADRRHWRGYREAATPHSQWLSQALSDFCAKLLEVLDPRPPTSSHKNQTQSDNNKDVPLSNGGINHNTSASSQPGASVPPSANPTSQAASPTRTKILQQLGKLMTTCLVLRIDDFTVYKVSTGSKGREAPKPLICAEKATMPGDAGLLHAELTHFYYPGDVYFPVPPPKFYAQLSPVRVCVDVESAVWLCAFARDAVAALSDNTQNSTPVLYMDVRCEAIMPKLIVEAGPEHVSQQRDRPKELHICAARANITNVREPARANTAGTRADLASLLSALRRSAPPSGQFPKSQDDLTPIQEQFVLHAECLDNIDRGTSITPEMLWRENRNVWCFRGEPVWADFCGARASPNKPAPFLDALPVTAWLCFDESFSHIWCLARAGGLAGVQLNHYQLLFLLRQLERVSEMTSWLAHDAARDPHAKDSTIVAGVVVPGVEVNIVLPSSTTGQESSRDLDSVPLDSSSLQDLKLGSESTMTPYNNTDRDSGVIANQASLDLYNLPSFDSYTQPYEVPFEEVAPPSPGSFIGGLSSMRRGLTSLVTSIDGALSRDSQIDNRSVVSTASSDSDRYVLVACDEGDADREFREFEHGRPQSGIEMASEVLEERESSPSERSVTSSYRRRDIISTCTFRLTNIHIEHESIDRKTTLRLVADDLCTEECSAIPWDEFQSKFSMRARAWTEPATDGGDEFKPRPAPKVAAKLMRAELPRKLNDKGEPEGLAPYDELLEARLHDVSITLNMSTAMALSEFIEDELIAPPMPIEVLIENLKVHIKEDRPRSICAPPPQPLDLNLTSIRLTRHSDGIIKLSPPTQIKMMPPTVKVADANVTLTDTVTMADCNVTVANPVPEGPSLLEFEEVKRKMDRVNRENEELKKRLVTLSRIAEDNRELRAKVEEASVLRQCAHAAQQEAASLLADKQSLLEAVKVLQDQLSCRGKR